ncbi:MAG TPA: hypothetical protein H9812_00985, partial [Candidatus Gallimonas intestinigallinarum]|nr:hypothetical protein [Candidatus Gallimonas intestinigallinarum]
ETAYFAFMERLRREIIRFHAAKINLFDYRFFSFFTFTPIFDFEPNKKGQLPDAGGCPFMLIMRTQKSAC